MSARATYRESRGGVCVVIKIEEPTLQETRSIRTNKWSYTFILQERTLYLYVRLRLYVQTSRDAALDESNSKKRRIIFTLARATLGPSHTPYRRKDRPEPLQS